MPVAHFDIDAFYASVAVRDQPALRGKPLAVAFHHRRSVVLTASYEARPFGVRSAIPLYKALELCPELVVVPPDFEKYKMISREVFGVFRSRGHTVEGLSMDEAFVDINDCSFSEAETLVETLRAEVFQRVRLTISAGLASGKLIAKIASDMAKPNGFLRVAPGTEREFLAPLPVRSLWGVGPKTNARLAGAGVTVVADIAAMDDARLFELFGSWGLQLRDLANGIDGRTVDDNRETKSISSEETFEYDVRDERRLVELLRAQSREVAQKLERENLSALTVGVKIKRADFRVFGRQTALSEPTRDPRRIYRAALHCLRRADLHGSPVRLLGLRVASLVEGEPKQISLFS